MTENAVNTAVTSPSPAIPAVNRPLGTPLGKHPTRVLFLGAGELGKEVAIELMRLGAWVCAADSYAGAPAQQVAHEYRVLDMANAAELQVLFDEVKPDIIVPEVEAIATDMLAGAAAAGAQVVPSAEIAALCMDRERLRAGSRGAGLADHAVSFRWFVGRAARRGFGSWLSMRGQAVDELVWSRSVGGTFRQCHRCRLDRGSGRPPCRR